MDEHDLNLAFDKTMFENDEPISHQDAIAWTERVDRLCDDWLMGLIDDDQTHQKLSEYLDECPCRLVGEVFEKEKNSTEVKALQGRIDERMRKRHVVSSVICALYRSGKSFGGDDDGRLRQALYNATLRDESRICRSIEWLGINL